MRATPLERLLRRVEKQPGDGCWLWTGSFGTGGYGHFGVSGKTTYVHRFAFQHFVGPIPDGYEIDHLCCVSNCVRPDHLEAVTLRENRGRRDKRRKERFLARAA